MITILGEGQSVGRAVVIGDADALIALTLEKDPHHKKAVSISNNLTEKEIMIIFPVTVFPEAITTLKRAANQPKKAHLINAQLKEGLFNIGYLDVEILNRASQIFNKAVSKRNTFFDAIVAATAEELDADGIFSFDSWYPKLGFKLVDNNFPE